VRVSLDASGYRIDHVVEGDTVSEVLGCSTTSAIWCSACARRTIACARGLLTLEESLLMRRFERAWRTHLSRGRAGAGVRLVQIANGSSGLTMQPRESQPQPQPHPAASLLPDPQPLPATEPPAEIPGGRRRARG
jgi:hypothetical protein